MNRYVDERIAFSYPEGLRCTQKSGEYYLRRGPLHIFLQLPERDAWEISFRQAGHVRQVPRGSLDPQGQPIPTHDQWSEEYARHGFQGRANSILARTRSGEIAGKRLDLILRRGEWRICLRIDNQADFPLDLVEPILETMTFPGEELYEESRRVGPIKKKVASPYIVSLRHFPTFGRKGQRGRARYDVEYVGATASEEQLQAVGRLVSDEERLYEQAKLAIFRYYTERIYPLFSSETGRYDELWPYCHTAEEVMRLVRLSSLMVHEPREDRAVAIGLRFHCSWDEEHALGLRVMGSTIEAVGSDWVALDPGCDGWPELRAPSK
jgi:hypothetical protein